MEAQSSRSKYGSPPPYDRHGPMDEHRRVVAIVGDPGPGSRYSPPRYADAPHRSRDSYRPHSREHEHSSREYSRSRDYERGYEPREKIRDEHFESRRSGGDDLRHELESRRREEPKYLTHERSRSYERSREYRGEDRPGSDLRMRITEKRADRHDDREHRSLEDRDHRPMMQPSPPGSDRRRVAPPDGYISSRVDMERGKPRDNGARPIHHHPVPGPSVRREEPPERFHQKPPPDFSVPPRPDNRFHYKAWDANPEYVPKGRAYFEHDNREDGGMMRGVPRGRGIIRGIPRGRGVMRGRPFRGMGPTRAGFMPPRGMTRRGGYIPPELSANGGLWLQGSPLGRVHPTGNMICLASEREHRGLEAGILTKMSSPSVKHLMWTLQHHHVASAIIEKGQPSQHIEVPSGSYSDRKPDIHNINIAELGGPCTDVDPGSLGSSCSPDWYLVNPTT
uniref:Uncharacterized protein n=1 Tax=Timema tahoe TaxID=61484 RepID=A0A7R9NW59_9NEOP|nr:unnamed protein product [Timema tahoe]